MGESAASFLSGPWTGYYTYQSSPRRHRTDLILEFVKGRITGEGNDSIGPFVIAGGYDSGSGECYWTKTYVAAHDVFYRGRRNGKGITGTWEIGEDWRGAFRIWPVGEEEGEALSREAEETVDHATPMVVEV
ncbi:MAG TPA: hypothetical protein VF773_13770 [Verrucomicrobiae bacterium]